MTNPKDREAERAAIVAWLRGEEATWYNIAYTTGIWGRLKMLPEVIRKARQANVSITGALPYIFGNASNHVAASFGVAASKIERGDHLRGEQ